MTNVFGQIGNAIVFWVLPILGETNLFMAMSSAFLLVCCSIVSTTVYLVLVKYYDLHKGSENSASSGMKWSDIQKFPLAYWCLNIINCMSTCSTFVIMSLGPSYLITEGYTGSEAGMMIAIMNLLVVIAPFSGWAIDKTVHRCKIWIICCLAMSVGFFMMAFKIEDPVIWLMIIGLAFTVLNSSVNASVALVIQPETLGTAYGLIGFLFTSGLLFYPLVIGNLVESSSSWFSSHIVFASTNLISLIAAITLEVLDRKNSLFEGKFKSENYEIIRSDEEELKML
eukprot:TRINITY_DN6164_c0_g1_i1.p1 TRINITY_DN6164_c0_g1~~TRINITY_DN6164_c0_g1_i1.p1  ORF type:complete len:283 (-),score=21.80 TRINITY_DN6164_c0_g1_i1:55-903(-)